MAEKRSESERRLRQSERLSRLLRVLMCISGSGHWDADALAKELECSRRTIHRLLQTLSLAGVPWYFDEGSKAYKVRPGFRFPLFAKPQAVASTSDTSEALQQAQQALQQAEVLAAQLQVLCERLSASDGQSGAFR
jgi:predicted DNA-binding transcriptional regulator YafY